MSKRPQSVRSLKQLTREHPGSEELCEVLVRLSAQEEDRSVVITMCATLEHTLELGLLSRFRELSNDDRKELFYPPAPLASMSAKTRLAYAIGLCNEASKRDLDCIREIRNAFAHTITEIDFDTPEIDAVCRRIQLGTKLIVNENLSPKDFFVNALLLYALYFEGLTWGFDDEILARYIAS